MLVAKVSSPAETTSAEQSSRKLSHSLLFPKITVIKSDVVQMNLHSHCAESLFKLKGERRALSGKLQATT